MHICGYTVNRSWPIQGNMKMKMCLTHLVRGKGRLSMAVQRMQRLQSGHLDSIRLSFSARQASWQKINAMDEERMQQVALNQVPAAPTKPKVDRLKRLVTATRRPRVATCFSSTSAQVGHTSQEDARSPGLSWLDIVAFRQSIPMREAGIEWKTSRGRP